MKFNFFKTNNLSILNKLLDILINTFVRTIKYKPSKNEKITTYYYCIICNNLSKFA